MKIQITTNPKQVEVVNMILARASEELESKQELLDYLGINKSDVDNVKKFRKNLLKALLK